MNVDVVVVTHRSAETIAACLASLPRHATRPIVIDNDSHDDGPQIARRLGATVVENTVNIGFGAAANQGAALGAAPAVLFLNPDAQLTRGALESMLRRFADPRVGIVGGSLRNIDGGRQRTLWPYPSAGGQWREALGLDRLRWWQPQGGFVVGACFLVRRAVLDELGGFDRAYWLYGEETDLCARAERAGWRVELAHDAICLHVGGASGRESSELVAEHFAAGGDRFVHDHGSPAALLSYRLAGLVGSSLRWPALRVLRSGDPRGSVRARQIRRTARLLLRHPTTVGTPPRPPSEPQRRLVVFSLEPWDEIWRRNQLLVEQLLRLDPALEVLWVDPVRDLLHDARRFRRLPRPGTIAVEPVPGLDRVLRYRPRKLLPRAVWPFVDRGLERRVTAAIEQLGFGSATRWVNDNTYAGLVARSGCPAIYDITDDWLDAAGSAREIERRRVLDRVMLDIADEVVVCSAELERRRAPIRPVVLIPNGVDVGHFRRPRPRPADLPLGPLAVYVGTLHDDRIDVELVVRCATALPDVRFVLVGPQLLGAANTELLASCPNVTLAGPRPYADVPGYLQHAQVIIVPHVVSPFTLSLDPIKAYECAAVGRPTLATPVSGFVGLGGAIETAGPALYPDRLRALIEQPPPPAPSDPPSWTERAEQFAEVLAAARSGGRSVSAPSTAHRRRLVILGHTAVASGAEIALARLLPGLTEADVRVVLGEDGPIVAHLTRAGATVEILPMAARARQTNRSEVGGRRLPLAALVGTVRYVVAVRRRLVELQPDLVQTNSLKAALYGGLAARSAGVPVVWHVRDRIAEDYLPRPAVRLVRLAARLIPDAIIANSAATLATLGDGSGWRRSRHREVIHDPISGFTASPPRSVSRPVVAIVGRLAPWKGQDVFLRAFAQACAGTDAVAMIVGAALFGEDAYDVELHHLAKQLEIDEQVTFTGHCDDVAALLGEVDLVVHASVLPEPFGQVIVEAMAAGRCVIASNAGGPTEIIADGVNGVLVEPGNVDALADAIAELIADPERRAELGAAAVVRAADFSVERIGRRVERLHRRVLAARRS